MSHRILFLAVAIVVTGAAACTAGMSNEESLADAVKGDNCIIGKDPKCTDAGLRHDAGAHDGGEMDDDGGAYTDAGVRTATDAGTTTATDAGTKTITDAGTTTVDAGINGEALYTQYCSGCHGSSKKGSSPTQIQNAINNNTGGMGTLSFLTPAQIAAISAAP